MFEVEQIRKNPHTRHETNWQLLTQQVLRTVQYSKAPEIFGHIDIMANQRPRIIKAIAESDVVILRGDAKLLFEFLDNDQMKEMQKSTSASNPYDIGQVYLNSKYDQRFKGELFKEAMQLNPFTKGQKISVLPPRDKYPTQNQNTELKN